MSGLALTVCILVAVAAVILIGAKRPRARMSMVYQVLRHGRGKWVLPPLAADLERDASSPHQPPSSKPDEAHHR